MQTGLDQTFRDRLFESYGSTHADRLEGDLETRVRWFEEYAVNNYLPHFQKRHTREANLLEIGCGKGLLLRALSNQGYARLAGVERSPGDLEIARTLTPAAHLELADGAEFARKNPGQFDVIIAKAVLEHVPRDEVLPLLEALRSALAPGGMLLIDVPNMDWLFAGHERYMDFTHECGFTRESLGQMLRQVLGDVQVLPVDSLVPASSIGMWAIRTRMRFVRWIIGTLLRWAECDSGALPIWSRSLIGVGRLP